MIFLWTMFVAGFLHGFGPDHLAAIAALTSRERNLQLNPLNPLNHLNQLNQGGVSPPSAKARMVWLGVRFALGHAVTLLFLWGVVWWLGRELPATWQVRLEQLGGVVLVFLGGWLLATVFRRNVMFHTHAHTHEQAGQLRTHEHLHLHVIRAHNSHRHPHFDWLAGGLMGFSGARALLTALPLVLAGSAAVVLTRAMAFGLGILVSMALAGWLAARLSVFVRTPIYARGLVALTGSVSIALGLFWLVSPPGS